MSKPKQPDALLNRGMKLSHLRMMAAFAETGQIGAAAQTVGITQPAASRLLAEIERIVGTPVHTRSGRGVNLTVAGQMLARRAERVLMEMRDAAREMAEAGGGQVGRVTLRENKGGASELQLSVIVNDGGVACVEGLADQCARLQ